MRITNSIRQWYDLKEALGVSLTLGEEEAVVSHLVRQGQQLDVQQTAAYANQADLIAYLKGKATVPIGVYLQGRGILLKQLPRGEQDRPTDDAIAQVFPAYDPETYYVASHLGKEQSWIAIVLKARVDELLEAWANEGVHISRVFIGPFLFDPILRQLNSYEQVYVFEGHYIETDVESQQWLSYSYDKDNRSPYQIKVGDRKIEQHYIPSYAAAFNTLMGDYLPVYALAEPKSAHTYHEQHERIKFKVNSLLLLCLVFVLLLVSTMLYNHYFTANEQLQVYSQQQQSETVDIKQRESDVLRLENQLKQMGWNGGIAKAWLLDQLGQSLHAFPHIALTDVGINIPAERKSGSAAVVQDNSNLIKIKGTCYTLEGLNGWVRQLSQASWVKQVSIVQFGKLKDYKEEKQFFRVDIIFNHDF